MGDRMDDARELLATLRTSIGDWTWHLPLARVERAFLKVTERVADAEAEAARRTDTQVAIAEALGLRSDATGTEIVEAAKAERAQREAAEGECARLRERLRSERAFAERMFERVPSDEDAVLMFVGALAGRASAAPNFVEWRGEHEGRGLTVTAQWADGKTPGEVIAAARAERDAAVAQREALAGAVRAYVRVVGEKLSPEYEALDALLAEVGDGR